MKYIGIGGQPFWYYCSFPRSTLFIDLTIKAATCSSVLLTTPFPAATYRHQIVNTDKDQSPAPGGRALGKRVGLLALVVFVTIVCLILAWVMRPSKYVVTCLFQIDAVRPSIFGNTESEFNEREFDSLRRTQLELLKSHFLLQSALRNPKIAALPVIQSEKEPISWLQNLLDVDFPDGSEVLTIRMHCQEDAINDYRAIVDSVAAAYLNEIVFAEDQIDLSTATPWPSH